MKFQQNAHATQLLAAIVLLAAGLTIVGVDGGKSKDKIKVQPTPANRLRSWGLRHPYDRLLYRAVVFEEPQFWRIISRDFFWVQKRGVPPFTVTQVVVADTTPGVGPGGSGATVRLIEGGPFYRHVKLHFLSQRGRGYNFIIDIFGV